MHTCKCIINLSPNVRCIVLTPIIFHLKNGDHDNNQEHELCPPTTTILYKYHVASLTLPVGNEPTQNKIYKLPIHYRLFESSTPKKHANFPYELRK